MSSVVNANVLFNVPSTVKADEKQEMVEDDETADEEDPLLRSEDGISDAAGRIGKQFEQSWTDNCDRTLYVTDQKQG